MANYKDEPIPLDGVQWEIEEGLDPKKNGGISDMFHFRYDYRFPDMMAVARRGPCVCEGCLNFLDKRCEIGRNPRDNYHYKYNSPQCKLSAVFGNYNGWNQFKLRKKIDKQSHTDQREKNAVNELVNVVKQDALTYRSELAEKEARMGGYGALACVDPDDPFYLVEFKSDPYMLEEDTYVYGEEWMPEGTVVVDGIFYTAVPRHRGWYAPPDDREDEEVFQIQHFLTGKLDVGQATESNPEPKLKRNDLVGKLVHLDSKEIDRMLAESHVRDSLELVEIEGVECSDAEDDEEEEWSEEASSEEEEEEESESEDDD